MRTSGKQTGKICYTIDRVSCDIVFADEEEACLSACCQVKENS